MAKTKEPKVVLEELIKHLAVNKELVEYTRKEVPTPGQTAGAAMMVEYVHSDTKNPFELAMVSTPNEASGAKVEFPVPRELTDEQSDTIATDGRKLAGNVEGNLSINHNLINLSYTLMRKETDNIADASRELNETITR